MGGWGSGSWYRSDKKATVDESLTVRIRQFDKLLDCHSLGTLQWTWYSGRQAAISYLVQPDDVSPTITLSYRWQDREDVKIPIQLQSTPMHFGGRRWWFTCPLAVDGVGCQRRVATLHSPPGGKYFGCRTCHGLTYESCQTAHQIERLRDQLTKRVKELA